MIAKEKEVGSRTVSMRIEPQVFLVGETSVAREGFEAYLRHAGAPDWRSVEASSDSEELVEFMGRICYRSWRPGMNPNVTKVREGNRSYLGNILKSKHGSVIEHATTNWVLANVSRVFTHELV